MPELRLVRHQVQRGVGDVDRAVEGLHPALVRLAVGQRHLLEHHPPARRRLLEDLGVVHQHVRAPLVGHAVVLAVDRVPGRVLEPRVDRAPARDQVDVDRLHPLAGDQPQLASPEAVTRSKPPSFISATISSEVSAVFTLTLQPVPPRDAGPPRGGGPCPRARCSRARRRCRRTLPPSPIDCSGSACAAAAPTPSAPDSAIRRNVDDMGPPDIACGGHRHLPSAGAIVQRHANFGKWDFCRAGTPKAGAHATGLNGHRAGRSLSACWLIRSGASSAARPAGAGVPTAGAGRSR